MEEGPFHFWSVQSVMFWLWKQVGQMWGAGVYLSELCSQQYQLILQLFRQCGIFWFYILLSEQGIRKSKYIFTLAQQSCISRKKLFSTLYKILDFMLWDILIMISQMLIFISLTCNLYHIFFLLLLFFFVSCLVSNVACVSRLFILDCSFAFL